MLKDAQGPQKEQPVFPVHSPSGGWTGGGHKNTQPAVWLVKPHHPQQRPKQSTVFWRKDLSSNPQLVVGSSCLAGSPPCLAAVASTAPWAHHRPALPRSPRPSKAPAPGWQRNHPPRCDKAEISGLGQKVGWFTTVVPLGKHLNQAESHGFLIAKTQLKYSWSQSASNLEIPLPGQIYRRMSGVVPKFEITPPKVPRSTVDHLNGHKSGAFVFLTSERGTAVFSSQWNSLGLTICRRSDESADGCSSVTKIPLSIVYANTNNLGHNLIWLTQG